MTTIQAQSFTLLVSEGGVRADRFIAGALSDLSRTAVQRLIDEGQVWINGAMLSQASYKVRAGDELIVHVPPPQAPDLLPEALPLDVLYEDADILVLNKAPGMVVHPGAGNFSGTLVNAVLAHCPDLQGIGGELRPGIVHRLDKDTSGVLVVAKHDKAIHGLQQQFKQRTVDKRYVALLVGRLQQVEGCIEAPVGRHPVHHKKMAVIATGKPARTRWKVLTYYRDAHQRDYTLIEVKLYTGRTHQIRVHFAWAGYPLVGDVVYGPLHPLLAAPRQFLHAARLSFRHPATGEELTFATPLPADLAALLDTLTPA